MRRARAGPGRACTGTSCAWSYTGIPWISGHQYLVVSSATDAAGNQQNNYAPRWASTPTPSPSGHEPAHGRPDQPERDRRRRPRLPSHRDLGHDLRHGRGDGATTNSRSSSCASTRTTGRAILEPGQRHLRSDLLNPELAFTTATYTEQLDELAALQRTRLGLAVHLPLNSGENTTSGARARQGGQLLGALRHLHRDLRHGSPADGRDLAGQLQHVSTLGAPHDHGNHGRPAGLQPRHRQRDGGADHAPLRRLSAGTGWRQGWAVPRS